MASLLIPSTLFFALLLASAAAQELPKRSGPADFDPSAPTLMLNDLPSVPIPPSSGDFAANSNQPPADVAKLEGALERAKKNAAFRERLCKSGVLSKLEAEQGQMLVFRLTKDLANARLAAAKWETEDQSKAPPKDDAAKQALADAEARLAAARSSAQDAMTKWEQAQRAAAEIRVQRERMLMALGAGSKSSLKRAEAALQSLTAAPAH
ncbi:MAG: hypothetical protein ABJF10_25030 [Chthoniobacter sp.]|uniref:hypothetical protein n=1 Tax=Chthoniobacter sp. TaxID=2510640 RepID=UPI0032A53195